MGSRTLRYCGIMMIPLLAGGITAACHAGCNQAVDIQAVDIQSDLSISQLVSPTVSKHTAVQPRSWVALAARQNDNTSNLMIPVQARPSQQLAPQARASASPNPALRKPDVISFRFQF